MGHKPCILIIDDNEEIVTALKAVLELKHEVLTAYNGFDGLKQLEQNWYKIDLVITDLIMPDLSGTAVISILKAKYPGIHVIAITGWRGDIEATGEKINADQLLEKPFEISALEKCISELLAIRGSGSRLNLPELHFD